MAIEIAIRLSAPPKDFKCKNRKQAIYVQQSDLEGPISEVRTIIAKQDIEAPNDYRFLSLNKNVIPWTVEETLILSDVAVALSEGTSESKSPSPSRPIGSSSFTFNQSPQNSGLFGTGLVTEKKTVPVFVLWITSNSIDATFDSDSDSDDNVCSSSGIGSNQNKDGDLLNLPSVGAKPGLCRDCKDNFKKEENKNRQLSNESNENCPWKGFVNLVHGRSNPQNLFKIVFFLLVILFMMLVSLVLTTHLVLGIFTSLSTTSTEFGSIFAKMRFDGGQNEELTNMRVKLSELEISWKYRFDQVNSKLMELEDLYINDLAVHKRELASLKTRQMEMAGTFATEKDVEALRSKNEQLPDFAKMPKEEETSKANDKKNEQFQVKRPFRD